jgi:hypothetical protein
MATDADEIRWAEEQLAKADANLNRVIWLALEKVVAKLTPEAQAAFAEGERLRKAAPARPGVGTDQERATS